MRKYGVILMNVSLLMLIIILAIEGDYLGQSWGKETRHFFVVASGLIGLITSVSAFWCFMPHGRVRQ